MKKRIVIFGATGGTGQELVKQAIKGGHEVTAFVRNPSKLSVDSHLLKVIQGDVMDAVAVDQAIASQDAVLCALGMPASDKSMLRTEGTVNIMRSMKDYKVDRLICQTCLGYGDSKEVLPWHMKYLVVPFILKNAFRDHELQESKIVESNLSWTIVRPGNMTNGKKTEIYRHGFKPTAKIKLKISRADVAHFMLRQLQESQYEMKKVGISY